MRSLAVILSLLYVVNSSKYLFVKEKKNWHDADLFCKQLGTSLAVINNAHDNNLARQACNAYKCWFGLIDRSREGAFKYSNGNIPRYTNWGPHEPNNEGNEACAEIQYYGEWNDRSCSYAQSFICDAGSQDLASKYTFVNRRENWHDAKLYCEQEFGSSLAVITNATDSIIAASLCQSCWIDLNDIIKEGIFKYSNGDIATYFNWARHPENRYGHYQDCVALWYYGKWINRDCTDTLSFLCNSKPNTNGNRKDISIAFFISIHMIYYLCLIIYILYRKFNYLICVSG